jgi:hypothetical protein
MFKNLKQHNLVTSFFVFLCAFPTLRYIVVGKDSITLFDYLFSALPDIACIVVIFIIPFNYFSKYKALNLKKIDYYFLAYLIFTTIYGCFLSRDLKACFLGFKLSVIPMLFYFVGRYPDFNELYLKPVFYLFSIIGIIGFILYFFVPGFNMEIIENISGVINQYLIVRMTSIFWTPVVFGSAMGFTLLYLNHQYLTTDKFSKLQMLFLVFTWFGLILSVSRGPIICFVLAQIGMFFIQRNRKKIIYISVALTLLYVLSILLASLQQQMLYNGGNFLSLFYNMINFTVKSAAETATLEGGLTRVELWRRSWIDFMHQPWGYGLGKSGHIAWRLFKDTSVPSSPYSTDGWYLKLLGETGIPGALFFISIIYFFVVEIKKAKLLINQETTVVVLIFLFVLLQNVVSNVFDYYCIAPLFYLLLGHITNYFNSEKS